MLCIASPDHPTRVATDVSVRDLSDEQFVLHHLCSTDNRHGASALRAARDALPHRRRALELRKHQELRPGTGRDSRSSPAFTVRQELGSGTLVQIPVRELSITRRTLMIYREQGYVSDSARELIKIVRAFNWERWVAGAARERWRGPQAAERQRPPYARFGRSPDDPQSDHPACRDRRLGPARDRAGETPSA